jgi:hypothetical protein
MLLVPLLTLVTVSLSDASTAELRTLPVGDATAVDVHTIPLARLTFGFERSELALLYSPNLGWYDVTRENSFALMQQGGLFGSWWTKRLRLTLGVTGAYGHESYLTAAAPAALNAMPAAEGVADPDAPAVPVAPDPDAPANPQPAQTAPQLTFLPARQVLKTTRLTASLSMTYALSERWSLGAMGGYEVSGGLGSSERYLPLRRGPVWSLSLTHALTHRDDLSTALSGFVTDVPKRDGRFIGVTGLETWRHAFAPLTSMSLGAGATYLWSVPEAGADPQSSVLATGLGTFAQGYQVDARTQLGFGFSSSLAAAYNPILGKVTQQLSEAATAAFARDRTTLGLGAQAGQSLPFDASDAIRTIGASAQAGYKFAEPVVGRIGGTWTHQVLPNGVLLVAAPSDQWLVYATIVLTAPPMTL